MPDRADRAVLGDVSRETLARLQQFSELVATWTRKINLISAKSVSDIWDRHILDSVQVFECSNPRAGHWVDLGSGAGFPGAVVAILRQELAPNLRVTCVEADKRKAAFLRTVSRETRADFDVLSERIEALPPLNATILSARALTQLEKLIGFASIHLAQDGVAVFHKGERHQDEIVAASKTWHFQCDIVRSRIAAQSAILKIGDISRVEHPCSPRDGDRKPERRGR